jgi:hypothetical protein
LVFIRWVNISNCSISCNRCCSAWASFSTSAHSSWSFVILALAQQHIHQVAVPINGPIEVDSTALHFQIMPVGGGACPRFPASAALRRWPEPGGNLLIHRGSPFDVTTHQVLRPLRKDLQVLCRIHDAPLLLQRDCRTGSLRPASGVTVSMAGRYARDYYRASALRAFVHLKRGQPPLPWGGRSRAVPTFTLRASSKRR